MKKVLISGGGVSGLATALLLDQKKYEITIIERASDFLSMGFSIILWQPGYEVLKNVLKKDKIKDVHNIKTMDFYLGEDDLKRLHNIDVSDLSYSVARKDLINLLAAEFTKRVGKKNIKFGCTIRKINKKKAKTEVSLSDGTSQEYDLVILADGIHSTIRNTHFETTTETESRFVTYAWLEEGSNLKDEGIMGSNNHSLFLLHSVGDRATLAFYNQGDTELNKKLFDSMDRLLKKRTGGRLKLDSQHMRDFPLEKVRVKKAFDEKIVLIGDAYHAHPPTIGFGTSAALEDAQSLATLLNSVPQKEFESSYQSYLQTYSSRRNDRINKVYALQDVVESVFGKEHHSIYIPIIHLLFTSGGGHIAEAWLRHIISSQRGPNHD